MNKYLISADIEGITGVVSKSFIKESGKHYQLGCRYMTSDVNAVIQGILDADPDAEVVVRDAHGVMAVNIDLERLNPRARLIQGWAAIQNMFNGLDKDFKGVFLVGYHAGGHNTEAVLGHTMHSIVQHIKVNGKLLNEAGVFALYASHYNVPVAFISGDDHTIREAEEQLGNIVGAEVKKSYGRACISSLSLDAAKKLLEEKAKEAVLQLQQDKFQVFNADLPATLEIKFYDLGVRVSVLQNLSEILVFDPAYKFDCNERAVVFSSANILELLQRLNMLMFLVYGIQSSN